MQPCRIFGQRDGGPVLQRRCLCAPEAAFLCRRCSVSGHRDHVPVLLWQHLWATEVLPPWRGGSLSLWRTLSASASGGMGGWSGSMGECDGAGTGAQRWPRQRGRPQRRRRHNQMGEGGKQHRRWLSSPLAIMMPCDDLLVFDVFPSSYTRIRAWSLHINSCSHHRLP